MHLRLETRLEDRNVLPPSTRPKANAIQFTVDQDALKKTLDSKTKENVEPSKKPSKKVLRASPKKNARARLSGRSSHVGVRGNLGSVLNCGS